MKFSLVKMTIGLALIILSLANATFAGQSVDVASSKEVPVNEIGPRYMSRSDAFGRGIVNMLTFWLEVPRCMIHDNYSVCPGLGVLTGAIQGPFYGVARFCAGSCDVSTFGYWRNTLHDEKEFPGYVWNAKWFRP